MEMRSKSMEMDTCMDGWILDTQTAREYTFFLSFLDFYFLGKISMPAYLCLFFLDMNLSDWW